MVPPSKKLFNQVRKGNEEAFCKIFKAYSPRFYLFVSKYTGDPSAAKDIVQEFFIHYWEKRESLDFVSETFVRYAYRSLVNASKNYKRDNARISDEFNLVLDIIQTGEAEDGVVKELSEKLKSAIDQLPQRCKDIFVAAKIQNKSYAEIAEQYKISENTVKVQVSKAYRVLREKFS